jgi:hypothetical protein
MLRSARREDKRPSSRLSNSAKMRALRRRSVLVGRGLRAVMLASCAFGCGSTRPVPRGLPGAAGAPSPARSGDCAEALVLRERALADRAAVRRLAALKAFDEAAALCPADAAAIELEAGSLRKELALEGAPTVALGRALLERARTSDDAAEGALLGERAVVVLEAALGKRLEALVPSPGPRKTEVFFTNDSERLVERHRDGIWLRRRGAWYPEFVVSAFGNAGKREDARLSGDGRTLMVPMDLQGGAIPGCCWPTLVAAVDVEPGPRFGNERARLGVNGRTFGFTSDGALFVAAEPIEKQGSVLAHEELVVADARTFAVVRRVLPPAEEMATSGVGRLALGKRFAVAQWSGGWLSVVDLESGASRSVRGPGIAIPDDPFTPDERYAVWASSSDAEGLVIFETSTGATRTARDPSCEGGLSTLFDPASSAIAIGGSKSFVCLFELASGRLLRKLRRRQLASEGGFVAPKRFTPNGAGIYLTNVTHDDQLFDVKTGRRVPIGLESSLGVLHARGTNGIIIGRDGRLATLSNDLRITSVTPKLASDSVVWSAHTRSDGWIALGFQDHWVLVEPKSGAVRPHSLPSFTDLVHSPDQTLLASVDRYGPFEVFSEAGGLVPGSPLAIANLERVYRHGDALVVRSEASEWRVSRSGATRTGRPTAPAKPCSLSHTREPGRFREVMDDEEPERSRICDAWTGERSASFPNLTRTEGAIVVSDDGARIALAQERLAIFSRDTNRLDELPTAAHPKRFVGKTRLITTGEKTYALAVWDLEQKSRIAELAREEDDYTNAYALSPDDRMLFAGRSLWDLATGRKLSELPDLAQGAEFWSKELLAVVSGARLTLYRVPALEPVLGMVVASRADAALAFSMLGENRVSAVQTFGNEAAWDTTFPCAVGNVGVPFPLCREVHGATGLFDVALAERATAPVP